MEDEQSQLEENGKGCVMPTSYQLIETGTLEELRRRLTSAEKRLETLENKPRLGTHDYKVSLVVVYNDDGDTAGIVDESFYFKSLNEAYEKQTEIANRREPFKRRILIVKQVSFQPV